MFKRTLTALTLAGLIGSSAQAYNPEVTAALKKAKVEQNIGRALNKLRKLYNSADGAGVINLVMFMTSGILGAVALGDKVATKDMANFASQHAQALLIGLCLYSGFNMCKHIRSMTKTREARDAIQEIQSNL